jgi:hypothetical protein
VNIFREEVAMIMVIMVIIITAAFRKCFAASKVPRQYPFVLLMEVRLREGKAVGSEKGKGLRSKLCYEEMREFEQGRMIEILIITFEGLLKLKVYLNIQFPPHSKHTSCPLQSPAG